MEVPLCQAPWRSLRHFLWKFLFPLVAWVLISLKRFFQLSCRRLTRSSVTGVPARLLGRLRPTQIAFRKSSSSTGPGSFRLLMLHYHFLTHPLLPAARNLLQVTPSRACGDAVVLW